MSTKKNNYVTSNELEMLADSCFLSTESIQGAEKILKTDISYYSGEFKDDQWILYKDNLNTGLKRYFQFSELNHYSRLKHLPNEFKIIVKCWICELLKKYATTTVANYYYILLRILRLTNGLSPEDQHIDNLISFFTTTQTISNKIKKNWIHTLLHFFDYSDIEIGEVYIKPLINLNRKIKGKNSVRILPPSKDILTFSHCLDMYYQETGFTDSNTKEKIHQKLLYYPVIIWWKLTTTVPLRPSEFCSIDRDCLSNDNNQYYITLPRHKYPKKHPNVIDKIQVDKTFFNLVSDYIKLTNEYGDTDTLISYNSILKTSPKIASRIREFKKINKNIFALSQLHLSIQDFHKKIITIKYGICIAEENQVRPNDSRHIAIFSLMMQGLSPVEIARLANHRTLSMQFSYAQHTEYWIDSEVFSLMQKFKFIQSPNPIKINNSDRFILKNSLILESHIPDSILLKAFEPPTTPGCKQLLQGIGFCSDEEQSCETEDCIFCSHWRVTPSELDEKSQVIKEKIAMSKKKTDELVNFIKNLHSIMLSDGSARINPLNISKLKSTSYQIKDSIREMSQLKILEGTNFEQENRS